ncbi:FHA domain-containing protein [Polyangium aurulentum]|uniref:FHA domain-containing protein n=1 Tax=Polyangium aurulentum TaxID=2567896 RepID=UPI0010AE71A8|nr:FHA domain-containing protein [Polyangium aurulentum]UQA55882.1 FHA domain-containing protein [Polyangium aurulentum]
MGLFDRFVRWGESRRAKEARARELSGELASAVELYLEAEMPDEAARVLLLRADAEGSVEQRVAFCATAARTAASAELRKKALARKALLSFDVIRARGGPSLRSELERVAKELEEAGELERAAEAYVLAGDSEAEVRVLTEMGAIERLEERFKAAETEVRKARAVADVRRRIADLERCAERRAALEAAKAALAEREDEVVEAAVRSIRARLLTGTVVDLAIDGTKVRGALGEEVTLGRGDATIVVAARAVSRVHVRIKKSASGEAILEDLGTRNGTTLAGARIHGPIPIGAGLRVELGGEVPCSIVPAREGPEASMAPAGVIVEVGGARFVAPLGELHAGPWRVDRVVSGGDAFVVLRTPEGAPRPILGELSLAAEIELSAGDELKSARGGPVRLCVLGGGGGA